MLEQDLRANIEERQRVLSQMKTLSLRYSLSQKDEQIFLNYSIPAVYAIWEGFVQTAFQAYRRELSTLNLQIDKICKPILINHLENSFKQFKEYPEKFDRKVAFFQKLQTFYSSDSIEFSHAINTESNVGFKVLNRILESFNLSQIKEYPIRNYSIPNELDQFLLKLRNTLAHGQEVIQVTRAHLDRAIKLITYLMDCVLDQILDGFRNRTYLHC